MTPRLRKLALTAHVASSVGWLGAVAGRLRASPLAAAGKWYVKFVIARPSTEGLDYATQWATLTFKLR